MPACLRHTEYAQTFARHRIYGLVHAGALVVRHVAQVGDCLGRSFGGDDMLIANAAPNVRNGQKLGVERILAVKSPLVVPTPVGINAFLPAAKLVERNLHRVEGLLEAGKDTELHQFHERFG